AANEAAFVDLGNRGRALSSGDATGPRESTRVAIPGRWDFADNRRRDLGSASPSPSLGEPARPLPPPHRPGMGRLGIGRPSGHARRSGPLATWRRRTRPLSGQTQRPAFPPNCALPAGQFARSENSFMFDQKANDLVSVEGLHHAGHGVLAASATRPSAGLSAVVWKAT
uniref:Serine/threonine protein kinase n=1 Tax=Macrostomum lignano TaxID=282301 RepID=A0A1I8FK25_9PLAT